MTDELREIVVNGVRYFNAHDVEAWHRNHMALSAAADWCVEFYSDDTGKRPSPACLVALEEAISVGDARASSPVPGSGVSRG